MNLRSDSLAVVLSALLLATAAAEPLPGEVASLENISTFAIGGVGIVGTTSDGEVALRKLLEKPAATTHFESLLQKATPAGKLYALLGLRMHDRAAYDRTLPKLSGFNPQVETMSGCIIWKATFKELRKRIEDGAYDRQMAEPARHLPR